MASTTILGYGVREVGETLFSKLEVLLGGRYRLESFQMNQTSDCRLWRLTSFDLMLML